MAKGRPPLRLAIPATIGAWAVVFAVYRFATLLVNDPTANDFRLDYAAARVGLTWGWSHTYDLDKLQSVSEQLGANVAHVASWFTFVNPLLLAWLVAPLTAVPLPVAFVVWSIINVTAFIAAWRITCSGDTFTRYTILLCSLAVWPAAYAVERGQPVLLGYALAAGCWWMAARRRDVEAGILLALAWALKPQDFLLLPAVLLLCGHARAAAWWLLSSAALWLAFGVALGPDGIGTYLGILAWIQANLDYRAGMLTALPIPGPLLAYQALLIAVSLVALWRKRRDWDTAFAIALTGTILASPRVLAYDYVALIVSAWLVLRRPRSVLEIAWLGVGAACAQFLAIGSAIPIALWQPVWFAILALRPSEPRAPETQAVAASAATRSWERATSTIVRSITSMCLSQSKRRAHSKARSPVAWFFSGSSSNATIPAA